MKKVQEKNKSETIEAWYDLHKEQIFYTAEVLDHKIKKTDEYIPFGPFISIGAFITIFVPYAVIVNILLNIQENG